MRRPFVCLAALALTSPSGLFAAEGGVDFNRDIRPILSDKCFVCHGPDEARRMAALRLDAREGVLGTARPGGPVVVPGDAAGSRLYQRISHETEAVRMPPPGSKLSLTAAEIDKIKTWIDEGARWETHWAFLAPRKTAPPAPADPAWARNPIDRFIAARLAAEGLSPSPEADRRTILRRVGFDLTGLSPTPAETRAFLDDSSTRAYENVVDRLLASPRFGERMAVKWLDLARYADTHGFHIDSHRDMWRWRDWVITAYNRNLPFDRFTIEQLAGDLLPDPSREQLIATGFNRNHMINFEGGAIPEEYQIEYVVDRVETTATVWLGLTVGCARCHDHKYDPISQREFYRFFAFFNTIDEQGLDGQRGNAAPVLKLPEPSREKRLAELEAEIAAAKRRLPEAELTRLEHAWDETALNALPVPSEAGLVGRLGFDGDVAGAELARGELQFEDGPIGKGVNFDGEQTVTWATPGWRTDAAFSVAFWLRSPAQYGSMLLQKIDQDGSRRGLEIFLSEASKVPGEFKTAAPLHIRLSASWPDDALEARSLAPVSTRERHHLAISYDGSGKAGGLRLFLDGAAVDLAAERDALRGSPTSDHPLEIGAKALAEKPFEGDLDELRLYDRALTEAEVEALAVHHPVRAVLELDPLDRSCEQAERVTEYYRSHWASKPYREAHAALAAARTEQRRLEAETPTVMIMSEMGEPRKTFILGRGDYRNHGEQVEAGLPSVLPAPKADAPLDRLDLAEWLVSPEHPLTARVAVNRLWEMLFGTGLVETVEDFGSQGAAPSHPELLDWLAVEFMESGWDVKHMLRLMVTSKTYRQSSRANPALIERDPTNRLLARGPRFRLSAEQIRDNALAVSGLLEPEIGGPSVRPYQPKGLWEDMAFGDRFTAQAYEQDHGAALYRRGLYTFWKRTVPPPSLAAFDAPDREKCAARRARTNTPLQALALLNDPTYVEAARALAARVLERRRDAESRLELAFELALARPPKPAEREALMELLDAEKRVYSARPDLAEDLLSVGESAPPSSSSRAESAAWTIVASALLNLDETVTKE